jgi:hypothetical protein
VANRTPEARRAPTLMLGVGSPDLYAGKGVLPSQPSFVTQTLAQVSSLGEDGAVRPHWRHDFHPDSLSSLDIRARIMSKEHAFEGL